MKRGWGALAILFLCGCPYENVGAIDDAHAAEVKQEEQRYQVEDKRYASCDDAPAGATCGLLVDQVSLVAFKTKVCGLEPDADLTDDCKQAYLKAFYKKLRARYPLADWSKVSSFCKGGVDRCNTLRKVERALLMTHNANAEIDHDSAVASMDKKAKAQREDAEDQNFMVLAAMGVVVVPTTP